MNLSGIKTGFRKYFRVWWIPIISYLIPFGFFILGLVFKRDFIIDFSLILFYLNILGSIISCVVQVFIKKWYLIFPQLIIAGFLFLFVGMIFTYSPPDFYGTHKKIPENIDISEPLDSVPIQSDFSNYHLVLTAYGQPGIYMYYTDLKPNESGYFFIKAYEVTSNDQLSANRLKERSKIKVDTIDSGIFSTDFTIYEGSWGDKYGARFELWFDPKGDKPEYKLTERNYIIEGWMR